ncbi:hypothetical protein BDD12DRAFT_949896 [Trichophaea hybrida]|nr:hypothetical protein BDD12DRAFT_949896 [Trichophaea hybrida]
MASSLDEESINWMINSSLRNFYRAYEPYFLKEQKGKKKESLTDLVNQLIDPQNGLHSLINCVDFVADKLKKRNSLAGVKGIYVLIDEYDCFTNGHIVVGDNGAVSDFAETYPAKRIKDIYSFFKSQLLFERFFITGISPIGLSHIASGFNIQSNVSFNRKLSGLCGLTRRDLRDAFGLMARENVIDDKDKAQPSNEITHDKQIQAEIDLLAGHASGFHFCRSETVDTVFNTATCTEYFENRLENGEYEFAPSNSEVNEKFLSICASSPLARNLLCQALEQEGGSYRSLEYTTVPESFELSDLTLTSFVLTFRELDDESSWLSYLLYNGALTFDGKNPRKLVKIPNKVTAKRIATAVLGRFGLNAKDIDKALETLSQTGAIEPILMLYHKMMSKRNVGDGGFKESGEHHVNAVNFSIFKSILVQLAPEFKIKMKRLEGRVYMVIIGKVVVHDKEALLSEEVLPSEKAFPVNESQNVPTGKDFATAVEWKVIQIDYLDIAGDNGSRLSKALTLDGIRHANQVLDIRFGNNDKWRHGKTIKDWVYGKDYKSPKNQVKRYFESEEITELARKCQGEFRFHLVVVVGNRKLLCWNVDEKGELGGPALMEHYIDG